MATSNDIASRQIALTFATQPTRMLVATAVASCLFVAPLRAEQLPGENSAFIAKLATGLYATIYCGDDYEMDGDGFVEWADGRGIDVNQLLPKFVAGANAFIGTAYKRENIDPKVTRLIRRVFGKLDDLTKHDGRDEACRSIVRSSMFERFIKRKGIQI